MRRTASGERFASSDEVRQQWPDRAAVPAGRLLFWSFSGLLFAASVVGTIVCCASMSAMDGMPMPGGWKMSMMWMRMPGQTWLGAAASFLGMWILMMAAMMFPSLVPALRRYRRAVGTQGEARLACLTALVGIGYLTVWTALGLVAFAVGVAVAAVEMRWSMASRAVPIGVGVVVLVAGGLQLTAWKGRHLACCREWPGSGRTLPAVAPASWWYGLQLGAHCSQCCASLVVILLVLGVMDPGTMAIVTVAMTVERIAPAGLRVARVSGALAVGTGLFLTARAAGLG